MSDNDFTIDQNNRAAPFENHRVIKDTTHCDAAPACQTVVRADRPSVLQLRPLLVRH